MTFAIVILLLCAVQLCFAFETYPFNGTCPTFDECRDHNVNQTVDLIKGIWYDYEGTRLDFDSGYKCSYYNYTAINSSHFSYVQTDYGVE